MRILVVEDEPAVLQALSFVLQQEGYAVKTATNGLEALDAVRGERVNLVILDLWMPVMNGWDFLQRLRSLDEGVRDVPVIAVSADVRAGRRELPVQAFMPKPVDIDELLIAVRENLDSSTLPPRATS